MNLEIVMSCCCSSAPFATGLLGIRLIGGKREVGSLPVGATFITIGLWVLGGAIELVAPNYLIFPSGEPATSSHGDRARHYPDLFS